MLISDTTCQDCGKISWKGIYDMLEKENPKVTEGHATADGSAELKNTLGDLADSFLHRIAASPKVLPYNDMVKWVIESINIVDMTLFTIEGRMFGSFKPEDLKKMYHLPEPQKYYNKSFLETFSKENQIELEPIRQCRHFPNKHKHESSGM